MSTSFCWTLTTKRSVNSTPGDSTVNNAVYPSFVHEAGTIAALLLSPLTGEELALIEDEAELKEDELLNEDDELNDDELDCEDDETLAGDVADILGSETPLTDGLDSDEPEGDSQHSGLPKVTGTQAQTRSGDSSPADPTRITNAR